MSKAISRPHCGFGAAGAALGIGIVVSLLAASPANAATLVDLQTATSYAVLAGSAFTNTGSSVVSGDIGVAPGSSAGGFPPGVITNGNIHVADAVTQGAQNDLTTAYNSAALQPQDATGLNDLDGMTLVPGTYGDTAGGLSNSGVLTLDAQGDPNAVWVFQSTSSLVTAGASTVVFLNGLGNACNVFWQVTSDATLGAGSAIVGTVMALTSITAVTGASVQGRLLARNGAVTLDTNTITVPTGCTGTQAVGGTTTTPVVPAPPGAPISPAANLGLAATGPDIGLPTSTGVALVAVGLIFYLMAQRRRIARG